MMRGYARGGVSSSASTSSRSSIASKTLRKSSQESCSMYSRVPVVPSSRRMMSQARKMSLVRFVRFIRAVSLPEHYGAGSYRLRLIQPRCESRDRRAEALDAAEALHDPGREAHAIERRRLEDARVLQLIDTAQAVLIQQGEQDFARHRREAVDEIGVARCQCHDALVAGAYVAPEGDRSQDVVRVGVRVVQQDGDPLGRDAGAEQGREHLLALRRVEPQPAQCLLVAGEVEHLG